jgi:hypothetical protein
VHILPIVARNGLILEDGYSRTTARLGYGSGPQCVLNNFLENDSLQLVEHGLGLFEVPRVEAFAEAPIDG